jgi:hypothetical protein
LFNILLLKSILLLYIKCEMKITKNLKQTVLKKTISIKHT